MYLVKTTILIQSATAVLMEASASGHTITVQRLLKARVNVNCQDQVFIIIFMLIKSLLPPTKLKL